MNYAGLHRDVLELFVQAADYYQPSGIRDIYVSGLAPPRESKAERERLRRLWRHARGVKRKRGRPVSNKSKHELLRVRLTEAEKMSLDTLAKSYGVTVSALIRGWLAAALVIREES